MAAPPSAGQRPETGGAPAVKERRWCATHGTSRSLDAEHDLGGLDQHGGLGALGEAEFDGGLLGDGGGDDLVAAVQADLDGGHDRAEGDLGDGAGQLVTGGQAHGFSFVGVAASWAVPDSHCRDGQRRVTCPERVPVRSRGLSCAFGGWAAGPARRGPPQVRMVWCSSPPRWSSWGRWSPRWP